MRNLFTPTNIERSTYLEDDFRGAKFR
jgi:hypothetical protein